MLTDPTFWLAAGAWLLVLVFALGLCAVAALADETVEQSRRALKDGCDV